VPVSSREEAAGGAVTYPCGTFRGSVVALDARSWIGSSGLKDPVAKIVPDGPPTPSLRSVLDGTDVLRHSAETFGLGERARVPSTPATLVTLRWRLTECPLGRLPHVSTPVGCELFRELSLRTRAADAEDRQRRDRRQQLAVASGGMVFRGFFNLEQHWMPDRRKADRRRAVFA
jgi:hypothetical protein